LEISLDSRWSSDRRGHPENPSSEGSIAAIYSLVPTTPKGYGMVFIYSIELSKNKAETSFFPEAL
jgi:hypothetical protein